MTVKIKPQEETETKTAKRPYSRPKLTVYGKLREITEAVGKSGSIDGGAAPHTKTRP